MADNTTLNAGTGGDVIASDDIGGVKYQRVKLSCGADGAATDVPVGGGVEAAALRVTLANDSTGVIASISTSVTPGTAAANLGKAIDAVAGASDTGVATLYVRQDTLSSLTPAVGDYSFAKVNANGAQWVQIAGGGIAGAVDDAALAAGTAEGVPIIGYYNSTRDTLDSGDGGFPALTSRRSQYVTGDGIVSTANSTTANLGAAAAFTGTAEDTTDYAQIHVSVFSSHASATDGLSLQQSSDGTNWDITDTFTIAATTAKIITLQPAARYFRLVYTNGGTLTTSLRIQTIFKSIAAKGSSQRPSDATSNENDFEMVSGFLHGFNGTTWDRLRSVNTGYLGVTPHFGGTAASAGNGASGAQTQRVTIANDSTGVLATVSTVSTLTNITNWGNIVDDAAFTPATTRVLMVGYQADETATDSIDEGDGGAARMSLDRKQYTIAHQETGSIYQNGTARTPQFAAISGSTSGDNTLVAAAGAGNKIRVTSLYLVAAGTTTVRFESGAGGTALSGVMSLIANTGLVLPHNPNGWFETAANTLLNMELNAAIQVSGGLSYIVVT